nr:MAG TPA: hypothetical protein [Caudoviricetes sp.]
MRHHLTFLSGWYYPLSGGPGRPGFQTPGIIMRTKKAPISGGPNKLYNFTYYNYKSFKRTMQGHDFDTFMSVLFQHNSIRTK